MDNAEIANQMVRTLYLSLLLSLPAVVVAAVVGIVFAVIQALTQIQEQTLSFAVKLVASMAAIVLTMRWSGAELYQFAVNLFDMVQYVGRH